MVVLWAFGKWLVYGLIPVVLRSLDVGMWKHREFDACLATQINLICLFTEE